VQNSGLLCCPDRTAPNSESRPRMPHPHLNRSQCQLSNTVSSSVAQSGGARSSVGLDSTGTSQFDRRSNNIEHRFCRKSTAELQDDSPDCRNPRSKTEKSFRLKKEYKSIEVANNPKMQIRQDPKPCCLVRMIKSSLDSRDCHIHRNRRQKSFRQMKEYSRRNTVD
jgi:hypothetical protein